MVVVDENTLYRLSPAEDPARAMIRLGSELIAGITLTSGDWVIEPLSKAEARAKNH
jgi:hypothetical protein